MGACSALGIRNHLSECNKNGERGTGENKNEESRKQPSKSRGYWIFYRYGYGWFLFWNWTHVKAVNNLECCINRRCL